MFVELSCGGCEAHLQIDSEDDTGVWMLIWRFTDAHTEHGFVTRKSEPDSAVRDGRPLHGDTG